MYQQLTNRAPSKKVNCPICGNRSHYFISIDTYDIFRCRECGHGFLEPLPGSGQLNELYNTDDSQKSNSNTFALLNSYQEHPHEIHNYYKGLLKKCISLINKSNKDKTRILEIGCSCGVFLKCLKDRGFLNVQGIDINPKAAETGLKKLGIPITTAPLEMMPASEKFHLILCFAIWEHLQNPQAFLQTIKEHLVEKGHVIFIVPNFNGYTRRIMGKNWLWYMPPFHLQHFTVKSIKRMVAKEGLKIIELKTLNTGTYLYLLYHLLFGESKTQNHVVSNKISFSTIRKVDMLCRLLLFPMILLAKLCNREAHIVGVCKSE